jgi:hypothetical protein
MLFRVSSYIFHGLLLCSSMAYPTFHDSFHGLQFSPPMLLLSPPMLLIFFSYALPCLIPPSMSLSMVFSFPLLRSSVFPPMLFHVTSHLPCLLLCYSWSPPICSFISHPIHVSFHGLQFLLPGSSVSPPLLFMFSSHALSSLIPPSMSLSMDFSFFPPSLLSLLLCSLMSHPTFHVSFHSSVFSSHTLPCFILRYSLSPPTLFHVSSHLPCLFLCSSKFSPPMLFRVSLYVIHGLLLFISMFYCMLFLSTYTLPCFLSPIASSHTLQCLISYFFFALYLFCALLLLLLHSTMSPNTSNSNVSMFLSLPYNASPPGHGLPPRELFRF